MVSQRRIQPVLILGLLAAVLLIGPSIASACPGCKEALASQDPNSANVVRGYFWSILFMMSMPFLTLGSFGVYMYLAVRRARAGQRVPVEMPSTLEQPVEDREPVEV